MQGSAVRKPEQAIKRADEYIKYGKYGRALEVMYESLQSRKNRTWQPIVEEIVQRFLSVCLRLLNSVNSKDVLFQYKMAAQYTNTATMELTFMKFIKSAEDLFDQALDKVGDKSNLALLEKYDSCDSVLCRSTLELSKNKLKPIPNDYNPYINFTGMKHVTESYVSQCKYQSGYNPICYLIQCMKFLWDCYRNVLDVCKNNRHAEKIYYEVHLMACKYCTKYNRKSEMKELCKITRIHAYNMLTLSVNPNYSIDLNDKKSSFYQVDLRLKQLEAAIHLKLYPQALKAVELIHQIMCVSERIRKPSIIIIFHKLMVTLFIQSKMITCHALAFQRFFSLVASIKTNVTHEELSHLATKTLLATLSIPVHYDCNSSDLSKKWGHTDKCDEERPELLTILEIFKLKILPKRKSLINELNYLNIFSYVTSDAIELYELIELSTSNINICQKISSLLTKISDDGEKFFKEYCTQRSALLFLIPGTEFTSYYDSIKLRAFSLLMDKLVSTYTCISMSKLLELVPFYSLDELYDILTNKKENLPSNIIIDDLQQCLYFYKQNDFNYVSLGNVISPLNMLYNMGICMDHIFLDNNTVGPIEEKFESFHKEVSTSIASILEKERSLRFQRYEMALSCCQRREANRKKREEQILRRREENKRQMDERARLTREKEEQKLENERQLQAIDEENKLKEHKQSKLRDLNSYQHKLAELELEENDKIRKAQIEFRVKIRTLERRIDHTLRAIRLEESNKISAYCDKFGSDFSEFYDKMVQKQESIAYEKFQYRKLVKNALSEYHDDILQFYDVNNVKLFGELLQQRINERKSNFIDEAENALLNKGLPSRIIQAKKDYHLDSTQTKKWKNNDAPHSFSQKYTTPGYTIKKDPSKPFRPTFSYSQRYNTQSSGDSTNKPNPPTSSSGPNIRVAKKKYF